MPAISNRTRPFSESVTRRMTRVAARTGAINLSQGFPDFDPPDELKQALATAAENGPHQHAVTWGAADFRAALCKKANHAHRSGKTPSITAGKSLQTLFTQINNPLLTM